MKRILITFALMMMFASAIGQVRMAISSVEVARNICDTAKGADVIMIRQYDGPRFLIKAKIVNNGEDKLFLSRDIDNNRYFTLRYSLAGTERTIEGWMIDRDDLELAIGNASRSIYPDSTYRLVGAFYDEDFPKENYCCAFYKAVPSMKLTVYTRRTEFPDDDILRPLESEKINMSKVRIKCDLER